MRSIAVSLIENPGEYYLEEKKGLKKNALDYHSVLFQPLEAELLYNSKVIDMYKLAKANGENA